MKLQDLAPNDKNPRTISDEKLIQLKKALAKFGSLDGVIYNRKTKQLVGGHQRSKIFDPESVITFTKKYSKPTKTGTVAEGYIEVGTDRYPYREVYWDGATEKAANIAANKGAGEWDLPQLNEWMKELSSFDLDFDISLTMFDDEELEQFKGITVKEHTRVSATGADEDEVPEKAPPRTKLGDVYVLGDHRLMCGDSTSLVLVEKLMNGAKVDMVFTDPPYGMSIVNTDKGPKNQIGGYGIEGAAKRGSYRPVIGDDSTKTAINAFKLCAGLNIKTLIFWGANFYCSALPDSSGWLCWDKENGEGFFADGELAWTNRDKQLRIFKHQWKGMIKASEMGQKRVHPTQKPIALAEWSFEICDSEAKSVLDLFGGSGSTLIACEKTHRTCYMMELDPGYCDVIIERWEKYTGKKAKLVSRPKTQLKKRVKHVEKQVHG